ncbi:unnamed protein product [Clavelina lepadiformis]|uniref:Methyltransferase domain-containing protein n=1 Tax=Clavelina lepadiformis TaxID=159417 RepID=A0ABP0GC36_CLALP
MVRMLINKERLFQVLFLAVIILLGITFTCNREVSTYERNEGASSQRAPSNNFQFKKLTKRDSAEESLETIWNYVYQRQYNCKDHEYLGGRALDRDGAYDLCLEDKFWPIKKIPDSKCIMYSFGVGNDFTFDDEIANKGCDVHSFDPTMKLEDGFKRDSGVVFHLLGVSNEDNDKDSNGWKMRTIRTIKKELGHSDRIIDYLKVDTDAPGGGGFEDMVMEEMLETGLYKCIRQFAMEIHLIGPLTNPKLLDRCQRLYNQLTSLYDVGYRIYNTTDNVRAIRFIHKDPSYSQAKSKPGMLQGGAAILWEVAMVNLNPEKCDF